VALKQVELRHSLAPPDSPFSAPGALQAAASGPAVVPVGPGRLTQLIDNLLDNAATHGAPPVTVTVDTISGAARLVISDAGPGMDQALLSTAIQRFARAPEARSRPGSGLGMSLVDSIVSNAGGQLRLCVDGRHEKFGANLNVACSHDERMTVTVLLPIQR
jgi:signal transduction histidine kinase